MILEEVEDPVTGLRAALAVVRGEGLAFGGTRFSSRADVLEVAELARCMEVKLYPHRPEIGGAKAGFFCSPHDPGLPRLMGLAAEAWRPLLESRVILGKDMGASDALIEELYSAGGLAQLGPIANHDAPVWLRDFPGYRRHMTGQGVCWALKEVHGGTLKGVRVGIQGAGAVGLGSAIRLTREGAHVVGISDVDRFARLQEGLGEDAFLELVDRGRLRSESSAVTAWMARENLFLEPVDAVVLAASSNSVDASTAAKLLGGCVVEGSNFGLTPEAREVLAARGVVVVPDVVASSSSAAMVAHQLYARGKARPEEMWDAIESCIRQEVREGLAGWKNEGERLRVRALRKAGL